MQRNEVCRNFQRGSCKFGDRCRYLHATQQQPKANSNNPFGFGTQQNTTQQQQQPQKNPFGFGVQQKSESNGANGFGNTQNQFKAFENKWTRGGGGGGATSTNQPENKPKAPDHKCTDPTACKRLIQEDYKSEKPAWILTCYGHLKYGPCDIVGDISFDELRAVAYDEAKQGSSLQSIIEREKNLMRTKQAEFEALLRNPYRLPGTSSFVNPSTFPGNAPTSFSPIPQSSASPIVSSFGQLNASPNTGFGVRPSTPPNSSFGQPNAFANLSQTSNSFGQPNAFANLSQTSNAFGQPNASKDLSQASTLFGQPNVFGNLSQTSNSFGQPNASKGISQASTLFGQPNAFANLSQTSNSSAQPNAPKDLSPSSLFGQPNGFGNLSQTSSSFAQPNAFTNFSQTSGASGTNNSPFTNAGLSGGQVSVPTSRSPFTSNMEGSSNQVSIGFNASVAPSNPIQQAATNGQSINNPQRETASVDISIWQKEDWMPGEIPEQAPPAEFCLM